MNENITPRLDKVLKNAKKEAIKLGNAHVGPEHVILAILETSSGVALEALKNTQVSFAKIKESVAKSFGKEKPTEETNESAMAFDVDLDRCLMRSKDIADKFSHQYIGTEHFLISVLENETLPICVILKEFGIDPQALKKTIEDQLTAKTAATPQKVTAGGAEQKEEAANPGEPFIKKFSIDLTEKAAKGELDAVVGRIDEIDRTIRILARKKKNNPVLIGSAGVGKTSIVEGLAIRIHEKKVPERLLNKKVFVLDFAQMVAGTLYRGQFEERLKRIVKEVKDNPTFIVFIDELHTVIGAGSGEGSMDAANMLKPALARGEFCCIGATTEDEFKHIESDPALERRFQKVLVNEPSTKETLQILKGSIKGYEAFHGVTYTADALEAAVNLSNRFIPDRFQPDKSIDILDEAGSAVKLAFSSSDDKASIETKLKNVRQQKKIATDASNFDDAQKLKATEGALEFKLNKIDAEEKASKLVVQEKDIQAVVAAWTGVPVEDLKATEKAELVNIHEVIAKTVVGQSEAVLSVSKSIKKYRTPLKNPNRPIGGFLFCGPTGVGKTLLAETIALKIFGSTKALLALDMSEYSDSIAITKLIGASAGYVGYEDGAKLCKFVRRNPYSVILFDEIEKAHEDVRQLLLQILENGRLSDNTGKVVDFKNTIIICTSNAGVEAAKSMGFGSVADLSNRVKENVLVEIKKVFKAELLNRLEVLVFNPLSKENARKVVELEIGKVNERLADSNIKIEFTKPVVDFILTNGFNEKYGARNVRRQVEIHMEDALTDGFLNGLIKENSVITFDVVKDKLQHSTQGKP